MLLMGRRKKITDQPRPRAGKNINAWLPADVVDAFHEACDLDKRGRAAELEVILTEYFKKRGLLPRPKSPPRHDPGEE